MENWNTSKMTPFDRRISTQSLQLMKLLIPYLPPQSQRIFAVYVKLLEFQHTFSSFHIFRQASHNAQDIIQELRPYMPSSACESIDNMMNMMSMMELFQGMQNSESGDDTGFGFDPMSMMQSMLSPEQQNMFDMYNAMFSAESETTETNATKAEMN